MHAGKTIRSYTMNTSAKNNKIGCIIMASGLGIRFGGNKLMADFGGVPMVTHILNKATSCFTNVVVVTRNEGVLKLCKERDIKVIFHDLPYKSDTVRLGIESLDEKLDGAVFCPADQPFLSVDTLNKMIASATAEPQRIWRTSAQGVIGSPNYFPRNLFPELIALPEDNGGSYVCKKHPDLIKMLEIENPLEIKDIDTKETYEELLSLI